MPSEKSLNQKALARIIDDLAAAGFIKSSVRTDKTSTMRPSLRVHWTQKGTRLISQYAEAMSALRRFRKRDREMFHLWLDRNAVDRLDEIAKQTDSTGD
jgi:DNA-binding PadR family transcriptional regulator